MLASSDSLQSSDGVKSVFGSSFDFATLGFVCSVSCGSGCDLRELSEEMVSHFP